MTWTRGKYAAVELSRASCCLHGATFLSMATLPAMDSHLRYLSGVLLGIGIGFAWAALDLERRAWIFDVLAPIVVLGGLSRALGLALAGPPPWPHLLALVMELVVTPGLWLWLRHRPPSQGLHCGR